MMHLLFKKQIKGVSVLTNFTIFCKCLSLDVASRLLLLSPHNCLNPVPHVLQESILHFLLQHLLVQREGPFLGFLAPLALVHLSCVVLVQIAEDHCSSLSFIHDLACLEVDLDVSSEMELLPVLLLGLTALHAVGVAAIEAAKHSARQVSAALALPGFETEFVELLRLSEEVEDQLIVLAVRSFLQLLDSFIDIGVQALGLDRLN